MKCKGTHTWFGFIASHKSHGTIEGDKVDVGCRAAQAQLLKLEQNRGLDTLEPTDIGHARLYVVVGVEVLSNLWHCVSGVDQVFG